MDFDLFIFSKDIELIRTVLEAGVKGIVIDWEHQGKAKRQSGFDTQINQDTLEDLKQIRTQISSHIICRINPFNSKTYEEIEDAIQGGADEILLPMVDSPYQVEKVLNWVSERCGVGILIETQSAINQFRTFASFPLTRGYVGLNDLAIERGTKNIFRAVADGIIEEIREAFQIPFGFAGLTVPDRGFPIPCRLLIAEMVRLRCSFSFLRRSFLRDIRDIPPRDAVQQIFYGLEKTFKKTFQELENEHLKLLKAIEEAEIFFTHYTHG